MKNHIEHVEIKNFKTLKHIKFDCKKINLFIGKPNVGKSNILEALSLFGSPYSIQIHQNQHFMSEFIRYKKLEDIFYDKEIGNQIEINTNIGTALLRYHFNINQFDLILGDKSIESVIKPKKGYSLHDIQETFDAYTNEKKYLDNPIKPFYCTIQPNGSLSNPTSIRVDYLSLVKKYDFIKQKDYPARFHLFLLPPDGKNLYTIIQRNKRLFKEITNIFKEYKLRFFLDSDKTHLYLQKIVSGVGIGFDYYGVADTLQRYIFYMLAIETNKDSVLLFEEPEAHSFPQYIRDFAQRVINDKSNQFFITTHSPYVLNTIIENSKKTDVAIFKVGYEKHKTTITPLSEKEISKALNYGNDIIFNL